MFIILFPDPLNRRLNPNSAKWLSIKAKSYNIEEEKKEIIRNQKLCLLQCNTVQTITLSVEDLETNSEELDSEETESQENEEIESELNEIESQLAQ